MKVAKDLIHSKKRNIVSTPDDTPIREAVALMKRENVGCLLVTRDDNIVGIWSERDLARDLATGGFDIADARIGDYMSSPIITCTANDSVYTLVDKILGLRIRHLIVEEDGAYIGLISAGDVMRATIDAKDRDLAKANARISWDYYEEWRQA